MSPRSLTAHVMQSGRTTVQWTTPRTLVWSVTVSQHYFIIVTIALYSCLHAVACNEEYVRLVNAEGRIIKDTISSGRVEMCRDMEFHTICDNNWNSVAASVLCNEQGFSKYGMAMRELCMIEQIVCQTYC